MHALCDCEPLGEPVGLGACEALAGRDAEAVTLPEPLPQAEEVAHTLSVCEALGQPDGLRESDGLLDCEAQLDCEPDTV